MKLVYFCLILLFPTLAFADRYGINDDLPGGGSNPLHLITGFIFTVLSIWFLVYSFSDWKKRRSQKENENEHKKDFASDRIIPLFGYAVIGLFLSIPLLLIVKLVGGGHAVREYFLIVFGACFALITFLRQT